MAAARPVPDELVEAVDVREAVEVIWRLVVDGQADDLALLRRRWPDRESPESRAAIERLKRRAEPGGDAEQAMDAVRMAYGGRVPPAVSERLERYTEERL